MKQFLLPRRYSGETRMTLSGGDFRYLARVLRKKEGDAIPAVDAHGSRYTMRIVQIGKAQCAVELAPEAASFSPAPQAVSSRPGPSFSITLLQCLPKGRKIDLIVLQATEAGVARIVPLLSEHTVVRPGEGDARVARLRRIAREALQQCGGARLPEIGEPRSLASIAEKGEDWGLALFFHEQPLGGLPLHRLLAGRPAKVSIVIGPEGGLSGTEVGLLTTAGFLPVHLGASVLRVETAATYALGAVTMILQERDAWKPVRVE
jgi:16S rRNA (uracil1498-N3)-methyltransferase